MQHSCKQGSTCSTGTEMLAFLISSGSLRLGSSPDLPGNLASPQHAAARVGTSHKQQTPLPHL